MCYIFSPVCASSIDTRWDKFVYFVSSQFDTLDEAASVIMCEQVTGITNSEL